MKSTWQLTAKQFVWKVACVLNIVSAGRMINVRVCKIMLRCAHLLE